ncbi:MAG: quinohemoprotein amine dehydrogenase maturation protein [Acidobacteriia bacterium]|nr:quinohemoprotein amine dehydrogenase maturation protein [Terriglobia bacterium]
MTAAEPAVYRLGEFHPFESAGHRFVYLVQSAGIFELDEVSASVIDRLARGAASSQELLEHATAAGFSSDDAVGTLEELYSAHAILNGEVRAPDGIQHVPSHVPLQTLVLNLTNQCNLSCQYCYEYGQDKLATPEGKPKFMDWETAKQSVDFLFEHANRRSPAQITFFGGETLMNFPVLKQVVEYARGKANEESRSIGFSLTTNATLLTPAIIDFIAGNHIGVTVSMDGPKEAHDKLRVFANGRGSYDIIAPKVRELIARHRTRPIAARVTLTGGVTDVIGIFRHLKNDLGFHEVGFAPVTTSPDRLYAINEAGMDAVLSQFHQLADEYLQFALRNELHGFSNVSDTLAELHQGINKSHPCGAGFGLMGVGPSGDIAPCHRFVDSDQHALGHISTGIDRAKQADFLNRGHIASKYDCHTCWARPVCAGGCHHEAFVRYGDTGHPNLHYCDWIRGWTGKCLHIYGAIAAQNPSYLRHFAERRGE